MIKKVLTDIQNYGGIKIIDKRNPVKILFGIVLVIVAVVLIYSFTLSGDTADTFERVNLSATCSLELPKIDFEEKNISDEGSYAGLIFEGYGKSLSSDGLKILYGEVHSSLGALGTGIFDGGANIPFGGSNWYTRYASNLDGGEVVIITGENQTLVDRIADSVIFAQVNGTNSSNITDFNITLQS